MTVEPGPQPPRPSRGPRRRRHGPVRPRPRRLSRRQRPGSEELGAGVLWAVRRDGVAGVDPHHGEGRVPRRARPPPRRDRTAAGRRARPTGPAPTASIWCGVRRCRRAVRAVSPPAMATLTAAATTPLQSWCPRFEPSNTTEHLRLELRSGERVAVSIGALRRPPWTTRSSDGPRRMSCALREVRASPPSA